LEEYLKRSPADERGLNMVSGRWKQHQNMGGYVAE
jgi:hypothetical protein